MDLINFLKIIFRGLSQVMLQNNLFTGLLFLIGIFYNSWLMGFGALIGTFVSTITAFVLNYDKRSISNGLYGFNGALVGLALLFFFEPSILLFCFIILGSILSSIIMDLMRRKKLMPYTSPFVLSTWMSLIIIKYFDFIKPKLQNLIVAANLDVVPALSTGFGQVMFQASIGAGTLFFLGLLVSSRKSAIYAFVGSFIGMSTAFLLSLPFNLINIGIFGFNGVLCGVAFADKKKYSLLYAVISAIFSVFVVYGMQIFNITTLTAPFVFATWATKALRKSLSHKNT